MPNAAGERRGFLIGDSDVSLTPTDCDHGIRYILNLNPFVTLNANFKCMKSCFIYLQGIIRSEKNNKSKLFCKLFSFLEFTQVINSCKDERSIENSGNNQIMYEKFDFFSL